MIEQERYGHAGWYKKMALKFQYGQESIHIMDQIPIRILQNHQSMNLKMII